MLLKRLILPLCLGFGLTGLYCGASAQLLYHVHIDTSNLSSVATYYAEFTLSDGSVVSSGIPDTNNSVDISAFMFGTGGPGLILSPIGNASGDMGSTVHLADGDPGGVADFAQAFTPGSILDFNVSMTTNVDAGGVPDTFTMHLLDSSLNAITTNAPADTPDSFLRVDLNSPILTLTNVQSYGNATIPIPAPTISALAGPGATPEPGSLALLIGSSVCGSLVALRRRARRTARVPQKP